MLAKSSARQCFFFSFDMILINTCDASSTEDKVQELIFCEARAIRKRKTLIFG